MKTIRARSVLAACCAGLCLAFRARAFADVLDKIDHIIVIYGENRSFDNLYGLFPGADGLQNLTSAQYLQTDGNGRALPSLPPVWKDDGKPGEVDPQFAGKPAPPNHPFRLDAEPYNLSIASPTRDLVHRFYENQEQIEGGSNRRFAAVSDAGGMALGYYDGSGMKLWEFAKEYTLADHFFMGAFGGSFLNHFWLVCACTPRFPGAPQKMVSAVNADGWTLARSTDSPEDPLLGPPQWVRDGALTPDFYAVNTLQPPYEPSGIPPAPGGDPAFADPARHPLPPQTERTIGDELSDKGVSWAWYAGAFDEALEDGEQPAGKKRAVIYNRDPGAANFQPHHQPFNYFKRFAPGTKDRKRHLKDQEDFFEGIREGKLPQVAFYKPQGNLNQHPGYADVMDGDAHIAWIIGRIRESPLWPHALVIVTYDENGGFWDHVPPPKGDRWGPGSRIPCILISPFVKKGFVDSTPYDTTSILKLITRRFKLRALPGLRPGMGDLTPALADE